MSCVLSIVTLDNAHHLHVVNFRIKEEAGMEGKITPVLSSAFLSFLHAELAQPALLLLALPPPPNEFLELLDRDVLVTLSEQ